MYGNATCPKCGTDVTRLDIKVVPATIDTRTWDAFMLMCPNCQTAIGAAIDPTSVGKDIVNRTIGAFEDMLKRR